MRGLPITLKSRSWSPAFRAQSSGHVTTGLALKRKGLGGAPAFSLPELLVVIALISIMAAAGAKSLTADFGSDQKKALVHVSNVMEMARQAAVANNTYTYVGFTSPPSPSNATVPLCVAVFQSSSGTDVMRGAISGGQPLLAENQSPGGLGSWKLLSPPLWLRNAVVESTESVPTSLVPEDERIGEGFDKTINPVSGGNGFSISRRMGRMTSVAPLKFDRVVTFSPSGTAFVDNTAGMPVGSIGVLVKPCRGEAPTTLEEKRVAAVLINGLLGSARIYQYGSAE